MLDAFREQNSALLKSTRLHDVTTPFWRTQDDFGSHKPCNRHDSYKLLPHSRCRIVAAIWLKWPCLVRPTYCPSHPCFPPLFAIGRLNMTSSISLRATITICAAVIFFAASILPAIDAAEKTSSPIVASVHWGFESEDTSKLKSHEGVHRDQHGPRPPHFPNFAEDNSAVLLDGAGSRLTLDDPATRAYLTLLKTMQSP